MIDAVKVHSIKAALHFMDLMNYPHVGGLANSYTASETIRLNDLLREAGFATKYKNWSVDELVGFGIFKLIE